MLRIFLFLPSSYSTRKSFSPNLSVRIKMDCIRPIGIVLAKKLLREKPSTAYLEYFGWQSITPFCSARSPRRNSPCPLPTPREFRDDAVHFPLLIREESTTTRSMEFSLYFRMDCHAEPRKVIRMDCLPYRQDRPA